MSQTDTPLTDAYLKEMQWPHRINVAGALNFARRLERDRAELIAVLQAVYRETVTLRMFDKVPPLLSESTRSILAAALVKVQS